MSERSSESIPQHHENLIKELRRAGEEVRMDGRTATSLLSRSIDFCSHLASSTYLHVPAISGTPITKETRLGDRTSEGNAQDNLASQEQHCKVAGTEGYLQSVTGLLVSEAFSLRLLISVPARRKGKEASDCRVLRIACKRCWEKRAVLRGGSLQVGA